MNKFFFRNQPYYDPYRLGDDGLPRGVYVPFEDREPEYCYLTFGDASDLDKVTVNIPYYMQQAAFSNGVLVLLFTDRRGGVTPLQNIIAFDTNKKTKIWDVEVTPKIWTKDPKPYDRLVQEKKKIGILHEAEFYPIDLKSGRIVTLKIISDD